MRTQEEFSVVRQSILTKTRLLETINHYQKFGYPILGSRIDEPCRPPVGSVSRDPSCPECILRETRCAIRLHSRGPRKSTPVGGIVAVAFVMQANPGSMASVSRRTRYDRRLLSGGTLVARPVISIVFRWRVRKLASLVHALMRGIGVPPRRLVLITCSRALSRMRRVCLNPRRSRLCASLSC